MERNQVNLDLSDVDWSDEEQVEEFLLLLCDVISAESGGWYSTKQRKELVQRALQEFLA